jgi:hypothetical protein
MHTNTHVLKCVDIRAWHAVGEEPDYTHQHTQCVCVSLCACRLPTGCNVPALPTICPMCSAGVACHTQVPTHKPSAAAAAYVYSCVPLQAAYCQVEPTHKFFWQEVARRVGTRTAGQCFDKVFAAAPSPPPAKLAKTKLTVSAVGMTQPPLAAVDMALPACMSRST